MQELNQRLSSTTAKRITIVFLLEWLSKDRKSLLILLRGEDRNSRNMPPHRSSNLTYVVNLGAVCSLLMHKCTSSAYLHCTIKKHAGKHSRNGGVRAISYNSNTRHSCEEDKKELYTSCLLNDWVRTPRICSFYPEVRAETTISCHLIILQTGSMR